MAASPERLIHATAIAVAGRAAILRGPSGSGKSDLALRCLAMSASPLVPAEAALVGDDQLLLEKRGEELLVRAPTPLAGLIEVRGIGIVRIEACVESARAHVLVDLTEEDAIDRLPDPWPYETLAGVALPVLRVARFAVSSPLKIMLALSNPAFPSGW